MKMSKKAYTGMVGAIILGFVALYVGAVLVPEIWDAIIGNPIKTGINGTTKTFLEMVPWMSAVGLMVSAVSVFILGARRRL